MTERRVLIAVPSRLELTIIEGSQEVNCQICGQACCIAPTSVSMLAKWPDMEIYCMPCLPKELRSEHAQIVDGGAEEIHRQIPEVSLDQARRLTDNVSRLEIGELIDIVTRQGGGHV